YGYDQLHRIVQARSLTEYEANGYQARATGPQAYDTDYSYDPNGNLLTLQRRDSQTAVLDDLTYGYYDLTNRLKNIDGSVDANYRYDEIEGRALRIFPVERFSEEPGCRGGFQMWE